LNADGLADVAVGAPRTHGPDRQAQPDVGAVAVVYGSRTGGIVELGALPPDRGYRITGAAKSLTGFALDGVADVNGDGRSEVLVGAPGRVRDAKSPGHAFLVFGRADGAAIGLPGLTPADGVRFSGPAGALFGTSVAAPGDIDADGRPDVAVGAPLADPEDRENAGSVFVLSTPPAGQDGPDSAKPLAPAQGLRVDGANAGDLAGEAVNPAGDIDADGSPDVAVSAPAAAILGRTGAGVTSIVYAGRATRAGAGKPDPVRIDLSGLGVNGFRVASGANTKSYVRTARAAGDLDGDGAADLIVGELEGRPTGAAGVAAPSRTPGMDQAAPGSVHVVLAPTPKPKPPPLPPDPGEAEEVAAGCKAATAVELIIDDSGSMSDTDPDSLRSDAVRLLLAKPRNIGRTFGAVEFGQLGGELFPPQVVADPARDRAQRGELFSVLAKTVRADNGGTDYNAGFAAASSALSDADARIFLTDGEHNVGPYGNGHRGGPRTFVVGLTVGRKGVGGQRLVRIAKETKATYYPSLSRKSLQPIVNEIDSRLNCDVDLDLFVDKLEAEEVGDPNEVELDEDTQSVELAVSWDDAKDTVTPGDLDLLGASGKRLATVSARAQRKALLARGAGVRLSDGMTLRGTRTPTFYTLRLTGVKRYSSMRVRTATRKVRGSRARINTQIGQSRRRR
ncbi:MAG: FG-GAP-like repeat-containing protein, partial [Actinomycetota bacterium]|nr:FG-GAP-like repeat-containing protein [Actinomycetota bacterium]